MLVGGLGTRLRPLTDHLPKPLLPVAGTPLIVRQIVRARAAGVDRVVLATSYRAYEFADTLGDGTRLGVRVEYAEEDEPLGTGGAIRNAADLLRAGPDDPVLVLNGDIIDGHDIARQVAAHRAADADVTLYLTRVDDPRAYGCVPTDEAGRVTAFLEKAPDPATDQVNAGCYVFRRNVIDAIPPGEPVSVERQTFPGLVADGRTVLGVVDDAYWRDLGTPQSYVEGCVDVVLGRVNGPSQPTLGGDALVLGDAKVASEATVSGGTSVQPGCVVGAGATVDGSVLLDDVCVGDRAVVRASAVGRRARVGAGAVLDRVVVGDAVDIPDGAHPTPGARLS